MHARLLCAAFALLLLSGCGTGVFTHRFEIAIADPSGRLGAAPIEISLFDRTMGASEEWARKTIGTAAPGSPFMGSYESVETKMMFDSSPARQVAVAVWLPAYEKAGYFSFVLEPIAGVEQQVTLPFAPWADFYPEGNKVVPIPASVRSEARDGAWLFHVTLDIPLALQP
jgi:hypothetical protein